MKDPRYFILSVSSGNHLHDLGKAVADWIEDHGHCWEPVGSPVFSNGSWHQAMFYREPDYNA